MIVNATMWTLEPFKGGIPVSCSVSVSREEFKRIQEGFLPGDLAHKWFVYYEAPYLFWHRSWTGKPFYRLKWAENENGACVTEMLWADDAAADDAEIRAYQGRLVDYLIDVLLLGKERPRPQLPREQTMGRGIHVHVERKHGDSWEQVMDSRRPRNTTWDEYEKLPAYVLGRRNDALFSVLAGVHNYDAIPPIAAPRGLPADMTEKTRGDAMKYDAHCRSYVYLRELLEYDWLQSISVTALVDVDGYREFKETGKPSRSFRCVDGPKTIIVSNEDMDGCLGKWPTDAEPYTEITWTTSIDSRADPKRLLDILKSVGGPDDVRIVFWFDREPSPAVLDNDPDDILSL